MSKRSNFPRRKQDAYDTPPEPVARLVPFLPETFGYWEPCAGRLDLVNALPGTCELASDVEPRAQGVICADALGITFPLADLIITNPPWTRELLHPMIDHFSAQCPTWLLFDADWMHTAQARPYLAKCDLIVTAGRVRWIEGTKHSSKDNCAWYRFDNRFRGRPEFEGWPE